MDEELNRAIDTALDQLRAARPAPDFLPRLRAHVEQAPAAPIRWWIPFAASAAAVIAGVIVAALLTVSRIERAALPVHAIAARAAVKPIPPSGAIGAEETLRPHTAAAVARPARPVRRVVAPPLETGAVLVPAGQLAALNRLLDAINAGDEHAASAVRRLGVGAEIAIIPIQIEPVVVPEIKETKESS